MIYLTEKERLHKESYLKHYSQKLTDAYRQRKSLSDFYWSTLNETLSEPMLVLDAGAGEKSMLQLFRERPIVTVGLDLSLDDLKKNSRLTHRVCADAQELPFRQGCFDLIVSQWLLEHLPSPRLLLSETYRVLRNRGHLILVSNSLYCPLMFFNASMPALVREKIKKALLPKEVEEDTFPTYYRANTKALLDHVRREAGYIEESFVYANDLSFFIFNKLLFAIFLLWDRMTEARSLRPLRMHFVALFNKKANPS